MACQYCEELPDMDTLERYPYTVLISQTKQSDFQPWIVRVKTLKEAMRIATALPANLQKKTSIYDGIRDRVHDEW